MTQSDPHAATDLLRSLEALSRTQTRWLDELTQVCASNDPSFQLAFRRWEEHLSLIKVHVHRAEQRLLHYLLVPEQLRPWRDLPGPHPDRRATWRSWYDRLAPYARRQHLDTTYRRIGDCLDTTLEAVNADIITDLAGLAEIAETTNLAFAQFCEHPGDGLEDLAFYHIISPWKQAGMPALLDTLRWLHAYLAERDEI